jgi:DNA-binding transcriptional ArsR family regulator
MQLDRPFLTITPTVDGDVLMVLARAEAAFTPPEVHRLIGARSEAGVRNALSRLRAQGVVDSERVGRAVTYRLNREHLAAGPITQIARLHATLIQLVRDTIEAWSVEARYAALFGSFARGAMRSDSDIDIFLARPNRIDADDPFWITQVSDLSAGVTRWTGNDTRVLEYSEDEVDEGLRRGDRVLADIATDGIALHGARRFLQRTGTSR